MSELFDFSKAIQALIKEGKFKEALQYYKDDYKKFNKSDIAKNAYIVSDVVRCLRKLNKLSEAKKYLDSLGIDIGSNTNNRILESYGWILYDKLKFESVSIEDSDEDVITGLIDENYQGENVFDSNDPLQAEIKTILPLLGFNSQYSPFSRLLNATLKKEKKKQKPNWQFINELLGSIDVNQLSIECESFEANVRGQQKTIELASDKETWYAYKTKALLKLGLFQECHELSQAALNSFENFHYNNNLWFARRIALCKKELGDVDVAIEEFLNIHKKKKEWFIQAELSELYFAKENYSEALKYGAMAATNFGDTEYKIGLFLHMGNILNATKDVDKSYEHYILVKLIREEHKWKITQALKDLLSKTKNNYNQVWMNSKDLVSHLNEFWKSILPNELKSNPTKNKNLLGEISNINPDKGFGFIKGNDKNDYYFKINQLRADISMFIKGVKVIYDSIPPRDEGKKPMAINIKVKG